MSTNSAPGTDAAAQLLQRLESVKESGSGWSAKCPAHEDADPSLSIAVGHDGRVLVKCFRGCTAQAVVAAVGLTLADLFHKETQKKRKFKSPRTRISVAALAADKRLPEQFLRDLGVKDLDRRGVQITYLLKDGQLAPRQRIRTALVAKEGSTWSPGTGSPTPYGLWRLDEAKQAGTLTLVEGESDCWTLWLHGFSALGLPGAEMSGKLEASHVDGVKQIFVIREPDAGGDAFVKGLSLRLAQLCWKGDLRQVVLHGAKDPNELHKQAPETFKAVFQTALDQATPLEIQDIKTDHYTQWTSSDGRYEVRERQTFRVHHDRNGEEIVSPLANFAARVVEETVTDDGAEEQRFLTIEGRVASGRVLPPVQVPVGKVLAMAWPMENWGFGPSIEPGLGARDHMRAAIMAFSGESVPRKRIFKHTGWRDLDGRWVYLHAGGAVGADGEREAVEVALGGPLARYSLPTPPTGTALTSAIKSSMSMLRVASPRLTVPIFASIWRAALGDADLGLHVSGPTGTGKTELTALAQQHFGPQMDARNLPGTWMSTANALEAIAFGAKDALFVVDDFAPVAGQDPQRFHRDADRLLRAKGNLAGRQRLNADATLKPTKYPRGLILSSGEDVPKGQSLRARLLVLEMSPGEMDWARLGACQAAAAQGLFAQALSGFVHYLAGQYGSTKESLRVERDRLAAEAASETMHKRTPRIVADLALGLQHFLAFAKGARALMDDDVNAYWKEWWLALGQAALAQAKHQDVCEPARRYLELLNTALAGGEAHVAARDGREPDSPSAWGWRSKIVGAGDAQRQEWHPQGKCIGWRDGEDLYLEPDGAFAVVQEVGRRINDPLLVTPTTLRKRLNEKGHLASVDEARGTLTIRRRLQGRVRDVLHMRAASLSPEEKPDKPDNHDTSDVGNVRSAAPQEPADMLGDAQDPLPEEVQPEAEDWPVGQGQTRRIWP